MTGSRFCLKIWGGRGSIPTPGDTTSVYGGNSACVEVRCDDRVLIFDAGSGIRELGFDMRERQVKEMDLLFSHFHYDHIIGLPFFMPFHDNDAHVRLWSGSGYANMTTFETISHFMRLPFFPVGPDIFQAKVDYNDFATGDTLDFGDGIVIKTAHLTHPGGCTGYRVEYENRAIAYVTDHEHIPGSENRQVLGLMENADIVIYDSTYTDEELPEFTGYGHSTWQEGVRLCKKAGAKKLVLFHHRPSRGEEQIRAIEAEAQKAFPQAIASRDHLEFQI